jgi:hypothetical protein
MKRLFAFIIVISIITSAIPFTASAEENYVNQEEAVELLRAGMVGRETKIAIKFKSKDFLTEEMLASIFDSAVEETGNPCEGDYLHWHIENFGAGGNYYIFWGYFYYDLVFNVSYYTDPEQEAVLISEIEKLIASFGFDETASDYTKIKTVYDYICENVEYDYGNLEKSAYSLKYSAYAALIDKKAVCQGYANLFYRIMGELGINCRIIAGRSKSQNHAWNVVELDGVYYNVDSTWDAGARKYSYFLKCKNHFHDHNPNTEYTSDEFTRAYPIATSCYDPVPEIPDCEKSGHDMGEWYVTREATCVLNGEERKDCKRCSYFEIHIIPVKKHTEGSWTITKQPEIGIAGSEELRCTECNTLLDTRDIEALKPEVQQTLGDINGNGTIEKYDYILVKRVVMSTIDISDAMLAFADVNKNGKVEKYDYILVKRHVMGTFVIEGFPKAS